MIKTGLYRHYKGGFYMIKGIARHADTLKPLVVYQSMQGGFDTIPRNNVNIDLTTKRSCASSGGGTCPFTKANVKGFDIWVRPLEKFQDTVDFYGTPVKRFTFVDNPSEQFPKEYELH